MKKLSLFLILLATQLQIANALEGDSYKLQVGEKKTITLPYSITSKALSGYPSWKSSMPDKVKVVQQNYTSCDIEALEAFTGYAIISCTYSYRELDPTTGRYIYTRTDYINYYIRVEDSGSGGNSSSGLSLNYNSKSMLVGEVFYLQVAGVSKPGNFDFFCNDRYGEVIEVVGYGDPNTFKVTAVGEGSAYITISSGSQSVTCWFYVKEPEPVILGTLSLTASPSGGEVEKGTVVKLTASESNANIYYTTDGTTPTQGSTRYTSSGITVNSDMTIKARAYKDNYNPSDILTATYRIKIDGIAIDNNNFPDDNFRNWILSQSYGVDGVLTKEEISNISYLSVDNLNISDLRGVEWFTSLTTLSCYNNVLTSLDLSKNTKLISLRCYDNNLVSLDLSRNTLLKLIYCWNNKLTSLNINNCSQLIELACYNNKLTSLYLQNNIVLRNLVCDNNMLAQLDLSENTELETLRCAGNNLSSLDVTKNKKLGWLLCNNNSLSSLRLTKEHTDLWWLFISNNQIKEKEMEELVENLPIPTIDEEPIILAYSYKGYEGNVITKTQVAKAKAKGWIIECWDSKGEVVDFGGIVVLKTRKVTLSNTGYATFYDSQISYQIPSGLKAYVVSDVTKNKLTYKEIADGSTSSNIIPKGTAVLLSRSNSKDNIVELTETNNNVSYNDKNLLRGDDSDTYTWDYDVSEDRDYSDDDYIPYLNDANEVSVFFETSTEDIYNIWVWGGDFGYEMLWPGDEMEHVGRTSDGKHVYKYTNTINDQIPSYLIITHYENGMETDRLYDNVAFINHGYYVEGNDIPTQVITQIVKLNDGIMKNYHKSYFYKLSYGPSYTSHSNKFGWYWGAENGDSFWIEGHKAWLAVPKSVGAKGYSFFTDDGATGIEEAESGNTKVSHDYVDLQGRRITKSATKGIYIYNGKKIIVK